MLKNYECLLFTNPTEDYQIWANDQIETLCIHVQGYGWSQLDADRKLKALKSLTKEEYNNAAKECYQLRNDK